MTSKTSAATRRRIEGDRPRVTSSGDSRPIQDVSTADLLTAAYALTHRMDHAEMRAADLALSGQEVAARDRMDLSADLRAQRDLITAEVLRRAGA